MAVLACVSSLGLFASGAGAAAVTGSVSCALTGQMFISGKPLSNAHPSNGEREAILRNRTATCQGTDIAGTKDGWSIEIGDVIAAFPLAKTTCNGVTALTLGHGAAIANAKLKHNRQIGDHPMTSTVAHVAGFSTTTPGASGQTLALAVRGPDFRNDTVTLTFDPGSLVAHCGPHQPNLVDYSATLTVG